MTRALSKDWLHYLSADEEDQDLIFHYINKSSLNGNFASPIDKSIRKCLEIGYSSGYWMMEMATDFPACQFYGIDIEPSPPDLVFPENCFFGQGDYLKGLPYQTSCFDMVYVRSLSTLGTANQIGYLLSEVARVTRKGGYIEFLELDHNPKSLTGPLLSKLMKIYFGDQVVGRQIDLADFGFINIKNNKVPIPLDRGTMVGQFSMAALKLFIDTMDPRTKSKLNPHDEDDLFGLIEKECKEYKSSIDIISVFAQKS